MIRALIASTKSIRLDRTRGALSYANAGVLRQGSSRCFSDVETSNAETPESKMESILRDELGANHVVVEDISGGCGSMYKMLVVSDEFEGLNKVKQHRLVQRALATEIADMHGLILDTIPSSKFDNK